MSQDRSAPLRSQSPQRKSSQEQNTVGNRGLAYRGEMKDFNYRDEPRQDANSNPSPLQVEK